MVKELSFDYIVQFIRCYERRKGVCVAVLPIIARLKVISIYDNEFGPSVPVESMSKIGVMCSVMDIGDS